MSPGPTAPAPLSKSTWTNGVLVGEVRSGGGEIRRLGEPDGRERRCG